MIKNRLSTKDKALFKLAVWTCLLVWMVFFVSYSIVMARIAGGLAPFWFINLGLFGQVLSFVMPVNIVFTAMLIVVLVGKYAKRKMS